MKKSGRTAAGVQRWKCTTRNASTTAATSAAPGLRSRRRSGPHPQETADFALFISWVTSSSSQARLYHGDDRAFRRRTSWCWQVPVPAPTPAARDLDQVFIDGIWLHHDWVLLIARTATDVIGWQWAARESTTAYQALLTPIPPPQVETTDGAPAALKALATTAEPPPSTKQPSPSGHYTPTPTNQPPPNRSSPPGTPKDDPHANASPQPPPSPTPPTPAGAPPPHHKKDYGHAKAGPDTPTNPTTRRLKHHVHADNPTHPS